MNQKLESIEGRRRVHGRFERTIGVERQTSAGTPRRQPDDARQPMNAAIVKTSLVFAVLFYQHENVD